MVRLANVWDVFKVVAVSSNKENRFRRIVCSRMRSISTARRLNESANEEGSAVLSHTWDGNDGVAYK